MYLLDAGFERSQFQNEVLHLSNLSELEITSNLTLHWKELGVIISKNLGDILIEYLIIVEISPSSFKASKSEQDVIVSMFANKYL